MNKPSSRTAYLLLIFLTFLNVLNFVDRQLIVNLAPLLTKELGLKLADVAWLYGYIFLVFYTIMGLLMATLADRWRRERLIAGGLGVWSALTTASGAALSFLHLALARMLVGIGEATLTPAALSILSDVFPAKRRALASGIYYAGVPLGSGLSLIVVGWMAPRYGWRGCFYVLGAIGLVLTPIVLLMKTPQRGAMEEHAAAPAPAQSTGEIYRNLFAALRRTPALWLTIAAAVLLNFSTSAGSLVFTWLVRERGMDFGRTGILNGSIVVVAGLLGTSGAGGISDWFHRRWGGGRLWFLFFKAFFIIPFTIGFYTLAIDAPWYLFYVCWSVSTFSSLSWYGPIFATVQDLAPVRIRATVVAFLLLIINIIGTGLGPLVAGKIGDAYTLWRGLAICAGVGYFAMIPLFFAARRYQKDLAASERSFVEEAAL
jgi:MFS family permease